MSIQGIKNKCSSPQVQFSPNVVQLEISGPRPPNPDFYTGKFLEMKTYSSRSFQLCFRPPCVSHGKIFVPWNNKEICSSLVSYPHQQKHASPFKLSEYRFFQPTASPPFGYTSNRRPQFEPVGLYTEDKCQGTTFLSGGELCDGAKSAR